MLAPVFGLLLALVVVDLAGAVLLEEGAVDGFGVVVGDVDGLGSLADGVVVSLNQVDEEAALLIRYLNILPYHGK